MKSKVILSTNELQLLVDALKVYGFELREEIQEYPDSSEDEKQKLHKVENLRTKLHEYQEGKR